MENKEAKHYKIETIEDIINCTNEGNIDNFLVDFKHFLQSVHMYKSAFKAFGVEDALSYEGFTWIDDGEHKQNVTLQAREKI
ncbi:hypothetical protein [Bernardetia sp.]|uniref:hypothetical protein n=1 Tax=Bernardetia sp. TaxID=1937974 RepID=UPI0025C54AEC|nr:hypothetical protein [Bernardetia sp.]